MKYRVIFSKRASRQLDKLDNSVRQDIVSWIENNLDGCEDPHAHGKPLSYDLNGIWRYQVRDYRVLAEIKDDVVLITIVGVRHRSTVYE